jgi:NADH-quinone oxidoreductase subunit H
LKETTIPTKAHRIMFLIAPILTFVLSLSNWSFLPFGYFDAISNVNCGVLFIFALSSFGVYGIILAGYASQSRYPFLGAIRSASQMISYEVSLGLIFVIVALVTSSLSFLQIVGLQHDTTWFSILLLPVFVIFFITCLAETNRAPFDLPEAEAELVAGYNLEYAAMLFALFFLAEYNSIFIMATLISILFLGGWTPLILK